MAAASAQDLEAERAILQSAIEAARRTSPLNAVAAYHAYASWLIANTPRDKNTLFGLLKEGTEAYRDDKSVYGDPNFADLWLWYAARVNKPNAVYTFCIRRKIGTERAKLYVEYAAYLIKANDRTKAEAVYQAGIARKAKPIEAIKEAFSIFLAADGRTLPPTPEPKKLQPTTAPSPALGASTSTTISTSTPFPMSESATTTSSKAFIPPPADAHPDKRAAWKRLTYMRQHVRTNGAPPPGRKREQFMLNLPSIFTADGTEYCFEEDRAKTLGLLDKKWPTPDPLEYMFPSERHPVKKAKAPKTTREGGTVKFAEVVVSHEAPTPSQEDSSFASTVSSSGSPRGAEADVHASRTTVLRRMGHMGTGFGVPAPEPTMTINTKESLDDVYGMMNSPEKTMRSGMMPGSKYAPVVRIEAGSVPKKAPPRGNALGRSTSSENAFRPFVDENAEPSIQPYVDDEDPVPAAAKPSHALGATFEPFVDDEPEASGSTPRLPAPAFKPFVDEGDDDVDMTPASGPLQPFVDDGSARPPPRTKTPSIQPCVDADAPELAALPAQTPKTRPFVPFKDKTPKLSPTDPPTQTPAFRPFVDDGQASGIEAKTPSISSRNQPPRRPLGSVTPSPAILASEDDDNDMDGVLPPPAPMNDNEWEEEEKRPELRPTTTPGNSTGEYSGTFRSITRTSSGDGSGVFSKPAVFVPRARTTSQGGSAAAAGSSNTASDDRVRSTTVGSTPAAPSIFRATGGSVFKPKGGSAPFRPVRAGASAGSNAGRQATKTPPPPPSTSPENTQPQHSATPSSVFNARQQQQRSAAPTPPPAPPSIHEPEPEPEDEDEETPAAPFTVFKDPSPVNSASATPPQTLTPFVPSSDEELHTPVEEYDLEEDVPSYRQHIGRTGAVYLMTPIAERTIEYTATTVRSVTGTPSRGAAVRESQQYAMYMANKREALREEDEEEEEEPAQVAQNLWPAKPTTVAEETVEDAEADPSTGLEVPNPCHPFEREILDFALQDMHSTPGFHDLATETGSHLDDLQKFAKRNDPEARFKLRIRDRGFVVSRKLGEGGFGAVFAARPLGAPTGNDSDSDEDDEDGEADSLALKVVRSSNRWEFHMIRQIHAAVPEDMHRSFISAHDLFLFKDESFLVLELCSQGTLLDVVNRAPALQLSRPGQPVDEVVVMFFMVELLKAVEALHEVGIIHGDLKIDNCLVRLDTVPGGPDAWLPQYTRDGSGGWAHKRLTLIDFGRAVDTRLFAPDQTFIGDWPTDARDCPEVRNGQPWTYQTDYYGLAGIAYCLLYGKYIDADSVVMQDDHLKLATPIKRYWQVEIWASLFEVLLNSASVRIDRSLPLCQELGALREEMQDWLEKNCSRYGQTNLKGALKRLERGVL